MRTCNGNVVNAKWGRSSNIEDAMRTKLKPNVRSAVMIKREVKM